MEFAIKPCGYEAYAEVYALNWAQTRVYLRKSKGERRIATLIDSPYLAEREALFTIVANGIAEV